MKETEKTKRRAVLIVSAGDSDVQVVRANKRHLLEKAALRALHAEILRNRLPISDTPLERCKAIDALQSGDRVCTPKLDLALQYAQKHQYDVVGVVVLVTQRGDHEKREPIASGHLLAQRASKALELTFLDGLAFGSGDGASSGTGRGSGWFAYLEGKEELAGTEERDRPVLRAAVERIDRVIRHLACEGPGAVALVATAGGIPAVKPVVDAAVRFHFGRERVILLDCNERANEAREVPEGPHPVLSYAAKDTARELLRRGDFTGAWGAVAHLETVEEHKVWVGAIRALHDWHSVVPVDAPCDVVRDWVCTATRSAHVALRVEACLRAGRIPEATVGTIGLIEAALADVLDAALGSANHDAQHLLVRWAPPDEAKNWKLAGGRLVLTQITKKGKAGWWQYLPDVNGTRYLLEHFKKNGLLKYLEALQKQVRLNKSATKVPVSLRNKAAHGRPDPDLMRHAPEVFQAAGFWAPPGGSHRFLTQTLVTDALRDVGVEGLGGLYGETVEKIIESMTPRPT
jgi:hypothetical protein